MLSQINSNLNKLRGMRKSLRRGYTNLKLKRREEMTDCYREFCIHSGYRADYSFLEVIYSLFQYTNETINFWTHFIPSIFFLCRLYSLTNIYDFYNDPYVFPLFCYMSSIILYTFVSAFAHAFSCTSILANHICFLLDYSTLSLYSWGAGLLYAGYSMSNPFYVSWFSTLFLPIGSVMSILATLCACFSRFSNSFALRKVLRLCAFMIPFIWDSIPLINRLLTCTSSDEDLTCHASRPYHITQFVSVFTASFFYGSHIPEIIFPGRFDFIGHSHNLMHIFATFATYQQMQAGMIDLNGRRESFTEYGWTVDPIWSRVITPLILFINFIIIGTFAVLLSRMPQKMRPFCCVIEKDHVEMRNSGKDDNKKKQ